jgi:hypothetical protein|tara:strand:- start:1380 stop:2714 length:1335 start_codon:yes stop_codon:yes gene_type:complete
MEGSGPYLGRIINHLDAEYMGGIEVEILKITENGNPASAEGSGYQLPCYYVSPFYNVTPRAGVKKNDDYQSSQQSSGFWAVPPNVGTKVIVLCLEENFGFGYWLGCVQDQYMNFMVPGNASTTYNNSDPSKAKPVGEFNKELETAEGRDPTKYIKPVNSLADTILTQQGLSGDTTRGTTTSSARREVPSSVFGWSTPGPYDNRPGGPTARYGPEFAQSNVPFSRLGGSSFVMDDGDMTLLRKTAASAGPPEFANAEAGDFSGDPTIPHNEQIRLRTRTGHQILLSNTEDLIYIGNAKGSTWIEMTSNGKIDIYAQDSVSIHTSNDLNITADRDIVMSAGRNICLKAGNDGRITAVEGVHIMAKTHTETAPSGINMNGPPATPAYSPTRTPQHEPWFGHENFGPTEYTAEKTDADPAAGNTVDETGNNFVATGQPLTPDTFRKSR